MGERRIPQSHPRGRRAARKWRQIRLGLAFAQFGLTALAVAFLAAPVHRRRARTAEEAELAVQRTIHRAYAASMRLWQAIGLIRVDAEGVAEELARQGTCIVVANHPTLIDVVLMGSLMPQMDCIVNAGWTANSPFLARAIEVAGYLPNDSGRTMVEDCASRLARGRSLLIFPEGTRSPWPRPGAGSATDGEPAGESLGKFQRGAAHIALAGGIPIVAVTIACSPRFLGSGR
jgi:1-acyl-sn-glycerol-3-phosphate acyltransferase